MKLSKNEVIGLDRGHGVKHDGGAYGIVREEQVIDEVCDIFSRIAKSNGYQIVELRPSSATSTNNALSQRTQKANSVGVDFYLSIHGNAYNGSAHGTEVYVYKSGGKAETLAKQVCDGICEKVGTYNRGVKVNSNLYVLKNTTMVAMLVELLFIDSQKDVSLYNPSLLAEALASALLDIPDKPEEVPQKPEEGFNGVVTGVSSYLNVRDNPNGEIIGKLQPNQSVKILEEKIFYRVSYIEEGKEKQGFVSGNYIRQL